MKSNQFFYRKAVFVVCFALTTTASANTDRLEKHIEFLASAQLEGRLTGSRGAQQAADYLIEEMERVG